MWAVYAAGTVVLTSILGLLFRVVAVKSADPRTFGFVYNFTIFLAALILVTIFGLGTINLNPWILFLLIVSGIGYGTFQRFQFTVRKHVEASMIQLLLAPTSIVGYGLAVVWLNEEVTLLKIVGYGLIIISTLAVIKQKRMKFEYNRYVLGAFMIGAALSLAVTIDRVVALNFSSVLTYTLTLWFAQALACYLPFVSSSAISKELKLHTWRIPFLAALNFAALICSISAIKLAPATKVIPVTASNVVVMALLGIVILKEHSRLYIKLAAALLTMLGLVLVSR